MTRDLWPDDFDIEGEQPPVKILREQATALGKKTKNFVKGEVLRDDPDSSTKKDVFAHKFYLVAPTLGNYRYGLLSIENDFRFYPLKLKTDSEIFSEIRSRGVLKSTQLNFTPPYDASWAEIESEEEFLAVLEAIFKSDKVRRIVAAIKAQAVA